MNMLSLEHQYFNEKELSCIKNAEQHTESEKQVYVSQWNRIARYFGLNTMFYQKKDQWEARDKIVINTAVPKKLTQRQCRCIVQHHIRQRQLRRYPS